MPQLGSNVEFADGRKTRIVFERDLGEMSIHDIVAATMTFVRDAIERGCPTETRVYQYNSDTIGRGMRMGLRTEWFE